MLNVAIVGIGRWGQVLVTSVQGRSPNLRYISGLTGTKSKAVKFCSEQGIQLCDDYDELLNNKEIDAIVLATPHTQHEEQIIRAAEAGKHIFAEKPLTLNKKSAERVVESCRKANVQLALGHNRRFMKNTEALMQMIETNKLGTLLHIDGNQSSDLGAAVGAWRDARKESPAGGMTSLGIHALDCMIHLGGKITKVDAHSDRRAIGFDIDDTTAVLVRFEKGMTGTLVTLASTARLWHVRVIGSKGWAEMRDNKTLTVCKNNEEPEDLVFSGEDYPHADSIASELNEFALSVIGNATYRISTDEMIHGISVLEGIIKSAELGVRITIQ